jgi:hypothetical protein
MIRDNNLRRCRSFAGSEHAEASHRDPEDRVFQPGVRSNRRIISSIESSASVQSFESKDRRKRAIPGPNYGEQAGIPGTQLDSVISQGTDSIGAGCKFEMRSEASLDEKRIERGYAAGF